MSSVGECVKMLTWIIVLIIEETLLRKSRSASISGIQVVS